MTPRHYITRLIGLYLVIATTKDDYVRSLMQWELDRLVETEQAKKWKKNMNQRNGDYK